MKSVDCHVHSKYSKRPSEWFLQKIGTRESYTEIEEIYNTCKRRGMDYVTISDHNTIEGALLLNEMHPEDTFVSVEATAYFPEDGCKIHLLVYDINESQFKEIDVLRNDIYQLRDYIKENHLAHSVAHATYSVNSRLKFETLEKLLLLFDVFEGINGARNPFYNKIWRESLNHLTSERIEELADKYSIEPFSSKSHQKGITGGSDDHAGLFIAETYTVCDVNSKDNFIEALKNRRTQCAGKNNNYKSMAFSIYKIAYDFSKSRGDNKKIQLWSMIDHAFFEKKKQPIKNWFAKRQIEKGKTEKEKILQRFFCALLEADFSSTNNSHHVNIDKVYHVISNMTDDFFCMMLRSFEKDFFKSDITSLIQHVSAMFLPVFLCMPFFSTLKHLHLNRDLIERLKTDYLPESFPIQKKVIWFTDHPLEHLRESDFYKKLYQELNSTFDWLKIAVTNVSEDSQSDQHYELMHLPYLRSFQFEMEKTYNFSFPSLLKSLEMVYEYSPERIIISSTGPVGLIGLFASRLLGVKSTVLIQSDVALNFELSDKDEMMLSMMDAYLKWIYSSVDEVKFIDEDLKNVLFDRDYSFKDIKI